MFKFFFFVVYITAASSRICPTDYHYRGFHGDHCIAFEEESSATRKERKILNEFFIATRGKHWSSKVKRNWNSSAPLCKWGGVYLNVEHRVVALTLKYGNVIGNLPILLWELERLKYVNLRSNPIHGYLPDILPTKRLSLRQLDLSWTKIKGPIPWKTLSLYENLTALQLGHNSLNGNIESAVSLLECLEIFTIGETQIRGEIPSAFQRLRHITALDFSFLQLKGHISQLFNLTRLRYAFLAGNSISGLFPSDFRFRFSELIRLTLNNNSISGSIPSDIAMPQNLTVLDLARNRIEGDVPRSFLNASSLYFLDLSRNNLTGFAPNARSANSPSLQYIDFGFNPFKRLTTKRLSELFIRTVRSGSPILTFDFTSTNLEGPLIHLLWNKDLNVVAFRLANNRLSGYFLKPRYEQYYVQVVNVSNNRLEGSIPEEINLLRSIKVLDVRGNRRLKSIGRPRLPKIAKPMYEVLTLTGANATYKCPEVRLAPTNGRLYVDSKYYKNVLCQCVPGHYGFDGACRLCFRLAFCPGNAIASPMIMDRNTFPVPNPDNVTHLIHCDSVYANTYPCNRRGRCTCRLNDDRATTSCNRSCLCDDNAIGQLCSQCRHGYYRNGYKCYACPTLSQKQSIALCFVAVLAFGLFLLIWFHLLRQFRRFKTRCFKIFLLVCVVCFSVVVVCFGFFRIVPAWMTEVYCFLLLLASFSRLNVLKSFVLTLVMYVQILDSLSVTVQQIDCPYCSFSATLKAIHVYKATKWFQNVANFNFYGFACIFPGLFTPIGRLAFLVILPLAGSAVGFLLRLLNHAITLRKKTKQKRTSIVKANKLKGKRYLSSKVKRSSKQLLLLLLNIFYFPIANQVIKILLPCHHVPNSNISFMKAYPWIDCSTSQYKIVFAFAVVVTATYITFTPIVFFCLAARRIDVARRNRRFLKKSSIDTLCSGYKKPYQKFMTSLLMIRRLAVAVVVAAFPYNRHDVQAIPFNVIVLGFAFFIAKVQPFRSATPWNLESWVDVATSFAISITYNCMTNSRRGSILSESLVLAVNVGLVIFIVVSSVVHLRLAFLSRHRRATQKLKIRHGGQYRHSDELICKF